MSGGSAPPGTPDVLVVEDDEEVADVYADMLSEEYAVRTAYGGEQALAAVDDAVDVVLLDRRMPEISGDEVLETIRNRGFDCRVAIITAVEPDFDIIDLAFDAYLVKPVSEAALHETVEALLTLRSYDDLQLELSSKKVRRNVLSVEKSRSELEKSEEFAALEAEIEALESQLADVERQLDDVGPNPELVNVDGISRTRTPRAGTSG